ncbi:hypothetical protein [Methylocaldum sp.]|uniref:hypothetical protein n=1 Tax=Methylocaldum sp. TaxID=1969727 RepID=UPI002D34332E|nr:hypothetical protein [Methylocaldum sp.]HYE38172.1 hypothetical protein [Methylocaldum sp.]
MFSARDLADPQISAVPSARGEVTSNMTDIQETINALENLLGNLEDRLKPVTAESPQAVSDGIKPPSGDTQLGYALNEVQFRLEGIRVRMFTLLNCCQL